jgi:DNA-binding response OmpR family regulator
MSEIERLRERVTQLEGVIGFDRSHTGQIRIAFPKIEPTLAEILAMLLKREFVTRDGLYAVLYGTRPDNEMPDERVLDVQVCRLRSHLKPFGIAFETASGSGWYMPKPQKTKLRAVIEAGKSTPDLDLIARREEQKRKRQAFLWE